MPAKKQFLVRHVESGQMATIVAFSERGALKAYLIKYPGRVAKGRAKFAIKARGEGCDWSYYNAG